MRRLIVFVCALVVGVASAVPASAVDITPGQFIGSGGAGTGESLAGDRFRSFGNTGGNENYLGVPSLGGLPRAERGITWTTSPLTSYDFTFQYDQANDKLVSTIAGGTLERPNWSADLITKGKTRGAADLNAFQISIGNRDTGADVYLTDVVLDGIALGGFSTINPSFADWLVTGPDMNLTDGFTLTGRLWLQGPFSSSQELSVVNLTAGWDARGVVPGACCTDGPGTASECIETDEATCEATGGLFLGAGTICTDVLDCVPLFVTMESVSAVAVRRGAAGESVLVSWTTATELDTIGFRVLRELPGPDGREKRLQVAASMIPAAGHGLVGATYQFLDDSRQAAHAVHYYIEDIDIFGRVTRHGPFSVDRGSRQGPRPAPQR